MAKFLTICILLSLLLPLINWALSLLFTRVQLPRTLLVFAEILLVVVTLLAITAALLDFHLIINRREYTPIIYAPLAVFGPYLVCLAIIQLFYARQEYKISYIFITNFVTLGLTLLVLYILPAFILYTVPILVYYGVHTFILTICEMFYLDLKITPFIKKQTWINKINLLEIILPKKNINAYILSSVASFCYSSLNVCVLLSYKTMVIQEYMALGLTCALLLLTGIVSFSLLVKYDGAGDVRFPGCLLIHFINQASRRCENLIHGTKEISKFTFKSLLFSFILVINGLGSTAFAMASDTLPSQAVANGSTSDAEVPVSPPSPLGEGQQLSRAAQGARQTMSWVGSEMIEGTREIPRNATSSIGSFGTAAVGAGVYGAATNYFESGQQEPNPDVDIEGLQAEIAAKDQQIAELQQENKTLRDQINNSFFNRFLRCFRKNP